ncbi:MAG TPA: LptF/LptG family permease [Ohtaekwangia sp.]
MKKIDKLVLDAFIGPFIITFLVVVFILLNINMLRYFDDIIGKGLEYLVIGKLFFYFAIFTIPTALPLSVLLSSLISFGNLGEHFELTAIKSAGVSLVRTMQPLFFFVVLLTGLAFYANNNLVPHAALEAYSLLYDIKQKKPAMDLREGAFYSGLNDISIKVNKKLPDGITLQDVIIYDHRKNDGNKEVTIADSGRMYTILNERYLKFELYDGYHYTEGAGDERELTGQKRKNSETLSRSKFSKTQVVFDMSTFDLGSTDKKWFQGNRIMRNISQLQADMDSIEKEVLSQRLNHYQYKPAYFNYYYEKDSLILPQDVYAYKQYHDSAMNAPEYVQMAQAAAAASEATITRDSVKKDQTKPGSKRKESITKKPTAKSKEKQTDLNKRKKPKSSDSRITRKRKLPPKNEIISTAPSTAEKLPKKKVLTDSMVTAKIDSLFNLNPDRESLSQAANSVRQVKSQLENSNMNIENQGKELIIYTIQWHKIFASSFACIAMFLIGAPLGAIIKRGGLGVPFLVSILFFIIYYILTMQGEKLAKQDAVSEITGVWMADVILLAAGLIFLRQARVDARLFEADFYRVVIDKVKRWARQRRQMAQSQG